MNQPAEEDDDASLARNVAILRKRMDAEVVRLRKHLDDWIGEHTCHNEVEITSALLEAAFEQEIALLGEKEAFDLMKLAFRRTAKRIGPTLQ
jgi:hypothetical protein